MACPCRHENGTERYRLGFVETTVLHLGLLNACFRRNWDFYEIRQSSPIASESSKTHLSKPNGEPWTCGMVTQMQCIGHCPMPRWSWTNSRCCVWSIATVMRKWHDPIFAYIIRSRMRIPNPPTTSFGPCYPWAAATHSRCCARKCRIPPESKKIVPARYGTDHLTPCFRHDGPLSHGSNHHMAASPRHHLLMRALTFVN